MGAVTGSEIRVVLLLSPLASWSLFRLSTSQIPLLI